MPWSRARPRILTVVLALAGVLFPAGGLAAREGGRKPNVVIILADDLGFTDLGCYGGEVRTPRLDGLAGAGLRFTQFYNTARCWPSRAAILSGYYPQQARMDPQQKTPPPWLRLLPHYLRPAGYRCYHSGKWHVGVMPRVLADGGFDRSYHLADHNNHFTPRKHFEDDRPLPPARAGDGYYSSTYIADRAVTYLQDHAEEHADSPFFLYLCFTAPHFPLHAPREDVDRCRERYQEGWDVLRERRYRKARELGIVTSPLPARDVAVPSLVYKKDDLKILGPDELPASPPWEKLTASQKRFQADKMAVHAAMIERMDREIGRVLDQLRAMNAMEDTLIVFLSDNGASAEVMVRGDGHDPAAAPGSAASFLCLGGGWAWVCNTPLRRFKIWVNEGGTATPLIVHWPRGLPSRGGLRHDVGHVIDLAPTVLDLAGVQAGGKWNGVPAPDFPGKSLVPAFARDGAVTRDELYFHHSGHKALRAGDWKAVFPAEGDGRELYDLARDRGESNDLAARHPDRVRQMAVRWQELDAQWRRDAGTAAR